MRVYHVFNYSVTHMCDSCCQLRVEREIDVSKNLTQTCEQYGLT